MTMNSPSSPHAQRGPRASDPYPWLWYWLYKLTQKATSIFLEIQEGRNGGLGESIRLWNQHFPNPIWHISLGSLTGGWHSVHRPNWLEDIMLFSLSLT